MEKLEILGRNIIIETRNEEGDSFITVVSNKATKELLNCKTAFTEQDALKDHDDMITTYALPLQARLHAAGMKMGERYTLVTMNDFGFPVALNFTFNAIDYLAYAQYDDAATIYCFPKGARKLRQFRVYNQSFALYSSWRTLTDDMIYSVEKKPGAPVVRMSKYVCCDDRYIADIIAAWPDFITSYQIAPKKPDPLPAPDPKPKTIEPREIAPGLTLMCDEDHGLFVDMTPETFAELYGPVQDPIPAEENLLRALRRATVACMSHALDEDGGTCNFDSPTLDYKTCGITRDAAERTIKAAGMSCYDWKKQLVISGPFSGQGNRRTAMARAFCESMTKDGVASGMYCQMD